MNLYELPTPNPNRKPIHHWGLDKSYKIVRVRSYEFVQISHLVKYVHIGHEIVLYGHWKIQQQPLKKNSLRRLLYQLFSGLLTLGYETLSQSSKSSNSKLW